jgi:hypothetical protein
MKVGGKNEDGFVELGLSLKSGEVSFVEGYRLVVSEILDSTLCGSELCCDFGRRCGVTSVVTSSILRMCRLSLQRCTRDEFCVRACVRS